jgi:hypothetical protein
MFPNSQMLRAIPLILFAAAAMPVGAQETTAGLAGSVSGSVYTSPTGAFRMEIPVLAALGGNIHDTQSVVTFRDNYGLQISIGAFAHDATQKWEFSTRGTKDYLIYFLGTYVLPDFKTFCPKTTIESAGFSPDFLDGSLFAYILLPGGSMFEARSEFVKPTAPPVAKRGNLLFVKNGFTIVISTELSERVTEGSLYNKTPAQEDQTLRNRLVDIAKKMQFPRPPAAK